MMKKLQIFGTGCPKCQKLTAVTESTAKSIGLDYELEKVTNLTDIMEAGIMSTPALAVDGEVIVMGKIPTGEELKRLLATFD
jgi:small redox-active disulfide protein 2